MRYLGPPLFGMTDTLTGVDRTTASFFGGNSSLRRLRRRRFLLYELLAFGLSHLWLQLTTHLPLTSPLPDFLRIRLHACVFLPAIAPGITWGLNLAFNVTLDLRSFMLFAVHTSGRVDAVHQREAEVEQVVRGRYALVWNQTYSLTIIQLSKCLLFRMSLLWRGSRG